MVTVDVVHISETDTFCLLSRANICPRALVHSDALYCSASVHVVVQSSVVVNYESSSHCSVTLSFTLPLLSWNGSVHGHL